MTDTNIRTGLLWVLAAIAIAPAGAQTSAQVLYNFGRDGGATPYAGVVRDPAGNLYGTGFFGGALYEGVVYKLDPAGHYRVLHTFTGFSDGWGPIAGVTLDPAGNLYGTTKYGGTSNFGVIYKIDPAGNETILYSFTNQGFPSTGVIRDPAGNLYGTIDDVVYELDTAGHFSVLYTFTGGPGGNGPNGLIRDSAGNFYGTAGGGRNDGSCPVSGCGVVFKLDPAGHETVLHSFRGGSTTEAGGFWPAAGVVRDSDGSLYGITIAGGAFTYGVVYKLDPAGHETVLYNLTRGGAYDNLPESSLALDPAGNLYGTLYYVGTGAGNPGAVYKIDKTGNYTTLYSFTGGADGGSPTAGVFLDATGNMYGTTVGGGTAGWGVVYKLDPAGHETVLHNFDGGADGILAYAGVIRDAAGNLYGTTYQGGITNTSALCNGDYELLGCGVVYKLDPAGHETVLYRFTGGADGGNPYAGVTRDQAGNLYGTTGAYTSFGEAKWGVVYKLDAAGNYTVLHSFTGGADGGDPHAGVSLDPAGNLYGTAYQGGLGSGLVYKLDTAGNYTVLYTFTGGTDGAAPRAGVTLDAAGNLYGTAAWAGANNAGVVYKLDAAGNYTVLYNFTFGADGGTPLAGVILDSAGNLYGTTVQGGITDGVCSGGQNSYGCGVVYKLDPTGQETVLYAFTGRSDGGDPVGGVTLDPAGNLYGTALGEPSESEGVVYKISTTGDYTVLAGFSCDYNGCFPEAGVTLDAAGNLYGTASGGGARGSGVVFEIKPQ